MKVSKLFLGLALILFAAVGAFATAKNTALQTVYYNFNNQCLDIQETPCGGSSGECQLNIIPPGETTAQLLTIYQTRVTLNVPCQTPFPKP
ncbi:hypothetical protein GFS24_06995 [Chitinophaga sp. SYP-B3965]|uniref:DUF6520 family protein n=1 Tax=Chitinophaga sp. SYP-B3965 TaxID=2663120 RepID=UPI001299948C|nr:DUF6520 family protein [Chitinophaga sp. SYP-B3965]MRG44853.1 hypothetical protein [Chitinophaga sp. SYP-B3965]